MPGIAEQCPLERGRQIQIWGQNIPGTCIACIMQAINEGPRDIEIVNDRTELESKDPVFGAAETFGFFNVERTSEDGLRVAEWYETINPVGDEDKEGEHDVTLNIKQYGFLCLWVVGATRNGVYS